MPRQTYGLVIKTRVKRLLEALLCFADGEFEDCGLKIKYDWKDKDSTNPKLTVETTLVALEFLTQKDKYLGKLTKDQIREALNLLKDFLNILEDNRLQIKGVEEWHFTLKLWSRNREKNLKRFDEAWENSRPKKSKELAANSTQDEGVATVPQTKLALFQAPPLPAHFVERPEYSDDLKTRLLNGSSADSRTLVITAIHGLGSVGKSTLAAALAHDAEVQTRFCDGILWATLGQQPNVLALLSGWVQALEDYSFKPTIVAATSNHLRTLLYDKAVLLVVDDAWRMEDGQAFNVGGRRCQVLVTTRDGAIADALQVTPYNLDVMTQAQAIELLTKRLGRDIEGAERQSAKKLAKAVGYLPLALELAAVQVASGRYSWEVFLQDIQQEIARLKTFNLPGARDATDDDEASLKRLSLTASLNLSIKFLREEERENFTWLGVLPEDVNITPKMAATLWDMDDERDASDRLEYLWDKALLLPGVSVNGTRTYRLHDLFHDLACNLLTASSTPKPSGDLAGLGLNLADAHAAFLEKYQQKTQNGLWHTLPDDGYIHQHLVWHLEKAGQIEDIHQLLQEESATGNNGWFEVRENLGQTAGYITDISRAWELAKVNCTEGVAESWDDFAQFGTNFQWFQPPIHPAFMQRRTELTLPQVVSLQCRYALTRASVNSLAASFPGKLLVALVKNNLWTAERGLAYALQNPNLSQKVNAITQLVNYLPPNLEKLALSEALTAASAIQNQEYRAEALGALADKLPDVLPQALEAAQAIQDESSRAQALIALADKLPDVLPQALETAQAIQSESSRTEALRALADKLPTQLLPEALEAARAISDENYRAEALRTLADKLLDVLPQALEAARSIHNQEYRDKAASALANKLLYVLPQTLEVVQAIQDEQYRADALIALADELPPELLPQALEAARAIPDEYDRAKALSALADKLPDVLLPQAIEAARAIQDEYNCAYALRALAVKLPDVLLPQVIEAARAIQDERYRAQTVRALENKLPPEWEQPLESVQRIKDRKYRAEALRALADKLPDVLPQALEAAQAIQSQQYRAETLSALADELPPEFLPEALEAARAIQSEYYRAQVLRALADKLPDVLPQALEAARAIQDEYDRAEALSALADKLPDVLPEALEAARAIQDEYDRAEALSALADKLPDVLPKALEAARGIQSEYYRAEALSALADKLPTQLLPQALEAAQAIQEEYYRAEALSALADKLPTQLLPQALEAAQAIQSESSRAQVLSALASGLSQMPPTQLLLVWQDTLHQLSLRTRPNLLGDIKALFPVIFALGGEAATVEIARAIVDVGRWWK